MKALRRFFPDPLAQRPPSSWQEISGMFRHAAAPADRLEYWWVKCANALGLDAEKLRPDDQTEWLAKVYWWKRSVSVGLDEIEYYINMTEVEPHRKTISAFGEAVEYLAQFSKVDNT